MITGALGLDFEFACLLESLATLEAEPLLRG